MHKKESPIFELFLHRIYFYCYTENFIPSTHCINIFEIYTTYIDHRKIILKLSLDAFGWDHLILLYKKFKIRGRKEFLKIENIYFQSLMVHWFALKDIH